MWELLDFEDHWSLLTLLNATILNDVPSNGGGYVLIIYNL